MTDSRVASSTYPETLARARTPKAGAKTPSQAHREDYVKHIGQEVGPAPAEEPAEEDE